MDLEKVKPQGMGSTEYLHQIIKEEIQRKWECINQYHKDDFISGNNYRV